MDGGENLARVAPYLRWVGHIKPIATRAEMAGVAHARSAPAKGRGFALTVDAAHAEVFDLEEFLDCGATTIERYSLVRSGVTIDREWPAVISAHADHGARSLRAFRGAGRHPRDGKLLA